MAFKDKLKIIAPFAIGAAITGTLFPVVTALGGLGALLYFVPVVALGGVATVIYSIKTTKRPKDFGSPHRALGAPRTQSDIDADEKSLLTRFRLNAIFLGAALGALPAMVASIHIDQKNKTPEQKRQEEIAAIEHFCKPRACVKSGNDYIIKSPK